MSKTKSLQKKTTGFDIFYRVVTVIMAVAMYPLFYFLDILLIQVDHKAIADIIGSITQNEKPNLHVTYESLTLSEFSEWTSLFSSFAGENAEPIDFFGIPAYRPLIAAIVFLAIALIIGLVIIGFAAFSNKIKVIMGLSGAGFIASVISYFCFAEGFAAPLISGEVSLATLIGKTEHGLANLLFEAIGEVSQLSLKGAFWAVLFLMLGILIWSLSVYIVNAGEEKEKEAKRLAKQKNK